jgi:serine phosphatase RsbU (regulator of sigma subunit)
VLRTLFSFRGLIHVFGLVALGLPIVLVGQLGIVRTLNRINLDLAQIRQGQLAAAEILRLQLDEESSVRGLAATGQRIFLEPYARARVEMPVRVDELREALSGSAADEQIIGGLQRDNAEWLRTVAEVAIARQRPDGGALQRYDKELVDHFRSDLVPIQQHLAQRYANATIERDRTIRTNSIVTVLTIGLIAIEIIFFAAAFSRMQQELDRERAAVETLQVAAAGRLVAPAHLAIGTAYRSATRGARIGGDTYDVYRLDDARSLIVVGDVSGKGPTAAVDTTLIRYAVRALAGEIAEPQRIMSRFDALYRAGNPSPEAFISLFIGIHDRRDDSLWYANAGHEACWIRSGSRLDRLPPSGPIVGVSDLGAPPFGAARTQLAKGDLLLLATDGLTEARDRGGVLVSEERVRSWILAGDATAPQRVVDALLSAVTRYERGRAGDDLAVLALTPR